MLGLEQIIAGAKVRGIAGPAAVEVVHVEWIGSDALNVVLRADDAGGNLSAGACEDAAQPETTDAADPS